MSKTYCGGAMQIVATGVNITTSGTSASATIPNDASGNLPKYVRVACTAAAYVRLGKTTATAVTTDMLINPTGDGIVLQVSGNDKIAAIQVAAAGVVQVSPLENQ